jgi:hypothetical protein
MPIDHLRHRGVVGLSFTARIERPQFHRGISTSKKDGPAPPLPFQGRGCTSTEVQRAIVPIPPNLAYLPLFGAAWLILDCARRTSTFLSCAFREHRRSSGSIPLLASLFIDLPGPTPVSGLTAAVERAHSHRARSGSKRPTGVSVLPPFLAGPSPHEMPVLISPHQTIFSATF